MFAKGKGKKTPSEDVVTSAASDVSTRPEVRDIGRKPPSEKKTGKFVNGFNMCYFIKHLDDVSIIFKELLMDINYSNTTIKGALHFVEDCGCDRRK